MPSRSPSAVATVYLVGAGPGDPGLLTLRGAACLRRADVVLYDYLANPRTLEHARRGAELVCLGRHGAGRIMPQTEINDRMVALARAGKTVVRLKGGDPLIFAHAAEECDALRAAGIPFEIVPGVTAALAAGSYAGVPLTHRDLASCVALVAGRENEDKVGAGLDFAALARFPGTLVFYMGVTSAADWCQALVRHGMPPQTPAALVRRCSWPDQVAFRTTLSDVPRVIRDQTLRPPVIVVVGAVADVAPVASWFTSRPLFGKRIVVTRPIDQADPLRSRLEELGAEVLVQPAIEIGPPLDPGPLDAALDRVAAFDWLVFSSANGVRFVLDRLLARSDARRLAGVRLAAIGAATAAELAHYALRADLVPDEYRAEGLAAALSGAAEGKRFLLARASRGRELLAEELRAAGATVEQVVAYDSRDVETPDALVAEALAGGHIDWITATSSAIARSLVALFGEDLRRARLASISPVTSATLRELGYPPAIEASEHTTEGVVQAILNA
ncbi:MAG: uroporphyrinogen-III C-methyltransferase [Planctomycetia bacterium]|nr:uroporphyrinogen-III C-methyltransferase [Planctomycetia bacterium]